MKPFLEGGLKAKRGRLFILILTGTKQDLTGIKQDLKGEFHDKRRTG